MAAKPYQATLFDDQNEAVVIDVPPDALDAVIDAGLTAEWQTAEQIFNAVGASDVKKLAGKDGAKVIEKDQACWDAEEFKHLPDAFREPFVNRLQARAKKNEIDGKGPPTAPTHYRRAGLEADVRRTIAIEEIVRDDRLQHRAKGTNPKTIREYMDLYDELPPVEVYNVGGTLYLVDGCHRLEAALALGREKIPAIIKHGTMDDAILAAAKANAAHGLKRSDDDKRLAVYNLLGSKKWSKRTVKWLADAAGVSWGFANKHKRKWLAETGQKVGASEKRDGTEDRQAVLRDSLGFVIDPESELYEIFSQVPRFENALSYARKCQEAATQLARGPGGGNLVAAFDEVGHTDNGPTFRSPDVAKFANLIDGQTPFLAHDPSGRKAYLTKREYESLSAKKREEIEAEASAAREAEKEDAKA